MFLQKLSGDHTPLPPTPAFKLIALAGFGGFLAIGTIALLAQSLETVLILGSFGASCVLVFGFPDSPFSQPRNVIAGHFLSSLIGLACLTILGPHWWSVAIAAGLAISTMMWTRTVHPPAGSNPVIVFLTQPSWSFLLFPTLAGSLLLMLVALLYLNLTRSARYPKYW
jgi:CBS-domain-containing membrane protein